MVAIGLSIVFEGITCGEGPKGYGFFRGGDESALPRLLGSKVCASAVLRGLVLSVKSPRCPSLDFGDFACMLLVPRFSGACGVMTRVSPCGAFSQRGLKATYIFFWPPPGDV